MLPSNPALLLRPKQQSGSYIAKAVHFDGATDFSSGEISGTNSSNAIISFWIRTTQTTTGRIINNSSDTFDVNINNGGQPISIGAFDSGFVDINYVWTAEAFGEPFTINDGNWHHVMASWDGTNKFIYVDGVDVHATAHTFQTGVFNTFYHDFGNGHFGSGSALNQPFVGDVADFYIFTGQYLDLSVSSNRLKFYNAGHPVNLGSDGSIPIGTSPNIYLYGPASTWSNVGTGSTYTLTNGALTDATTSPS